MKHCLFGLLHYSIPFLFLHVDLSNKFGHRNVYLPLKVLSARSVYSQKSYFYSRIPWAFPMATAALSLQAEPLGKRLPCQATPWVGGWVRASRNANLQPLTPLCCSREQGNRKQASKGKRSKVAWAGPWISDQGQRVLIVVLYGPEQVLPGNENDECQVYANHCVKGFYKNYFI